MTRKLSGTIALAAGSSISNEFALPAGEYVITFDTPIGTDLPTSQVVTLQRRFKISEDAAGNERWSNWRPTGVSVNAADASDVFNSTNGFEYRVVTGVNNVAYVHISEVGPKQVNVS